jgi:nucleoside phosphorylase/CheY-like chemotaxis protein
MKISILIADDDKVKIDMICRELVKSGISNDDIQSVTDLAAARNKLTENHYDLLLLDIVIPPRDNAKESAEHGVEFLRQIIDDELIPAPANIIGITSDSDANLQSQSEFKRMTTQILYIDPTLEEWKQSLKQLIAKIYSSKTFNHDVDVCFITALRSPELSEICKLPCNWSEEISLGNGMVYRKGIFLLGEKNIRVICLHCPQMGIVSSTLTTRIAIEIFKPRLMIMTGICGGIDGQVAIGDVILAEKSWDWQSGKWLDNGHFEIAPDQKDASGELISLARKSEGKLVELHRKFYGERPAVPSVLHVGPMVSGSAVVADPTMHERFISQHRKSMGIDMECYGVYFASSLSLEPKPKFICIKSVSDLANREKSNNFQQYCSYLSAQLGFELVAEYFSQN